MSSVVVDVTTRNLNELVFNLKKYPGAITATMAVQLERWYNQHYKKSVLEVIDTGTPSDKIPSNFGKYREWKARKHGFTHGLGRLSHKLYNEVAIVRPSIKTTRDREIRFSIVYRKPLYLAYVHEGFLAGGRAAGTPVPARPFAEVARDRELPKLLDMIGETLESLDPTDPKMVSTVLGTNL